jgi:dTDP-4-dehydrorhamnose 3,5-epimerase
MVRCDEGDYFTGFGEIYFSFTNSGAIKGWHEQLEQINLLSCLQGRLRLVLYDARPGSPTLGALEVIDFADGDRKLVRVPPGVIYGWQNRGTEPAILANCASLPHQPGRARFHDPGSGAVPYAW